MRVSEDRYTRDLRRIHLAQRLIRHEVRTQAICAWTGLTDERVRLLCRSYDMSPSGTPRHRGPSPNRLATFLRSPLLRSEASAAAAVACVLGVVPPERMPNARRTLPSVPTGERLCYAFELFRQIVPESRFTLDQLILLVITLAQGEELEVGHCSNCHAALLLDRLGAGRRLCLWCKQLPPAGTAAAALGSAVALEDRNCEDAESDAEPTEGYQQPLF